MQTSGETYSNMNEMMSRVLSCPKMALSSYVTEDSPLVHRIKINFSMFVLHSYEPLTQLERYGMRGLNTTKVLLDLLPLNL